MKKLFMVSILSFFSTVAICFGEVQREMIKKSIPTSAYIDPAEEWVWTTAYDEQGNQIKYFGIKYIMEEVEVLEAASQIAGWQAGIQRVCDEGGVLPAITAKNVSSWSEFVSKVIADGLEEQDDADQKYLMARTEELGLTLNDNAEAYNQALQEYAVFKNETHSAATSLKTGLGVLATTVASTTVALTATIASANRKIADANTRIRALEAKGNNRTDEEDRELAQLKKDVESLNHVKAMAELAKTQSALTETALKGLKTDLDNYITYDYIGGQMDLISKWFGLNGATVRSVMFPEKIYGNSTPQKTDRYNPTVGDNMHNYLGDYGIVQYDSIEFQSKREEKGIAEPPYPFYFKEREGDFGDTNRFSVCNLLPPKNWVDGVTIIYTNGVYVAVSGGVANVYHDFASIGTNMVEEAYVDDEGRAKIRMVPKTEILDFHTLQEKPSPQEYDFLPNATYELNERIQEPEEMYVIEWQTNDNEVVRRMLGLKKTPPKSEYDRIFDNRNFNEWFSDNGLFKRVLGETGIVERLNKAINITNAWDNASIWTNADAKVEVKGFSKALRYSVPMVDDERDLFSGKVRSGIRWEPYFKGDSVVSANLPEEMGTNIIQSIDTSEGFTVHNKDRDIDEIVYYIKLFGFADEDRKNGSVPYEFDNDEKTIRTLKWADPPDDVSADNPKVLTFNGETVEWRDPTNGGLFAIDRSEMKIGNGGCMVGGKWYPCSGTHIQGGPQHYWLQVVLSYANGNALSVMTSSIDPGAGGIDPIISNNECTYFIPIYSINVVRDDDNKVVTFDVEDYRGSFVVPAYNFD